MTLFTNLNDTIEQADIVSIGSSCEERCDPVSDLLCHALRTHAVVLQEQLDTTHKPGRNTHNGCDDLSFWCFTGCV